MAHTDHTTHNPSQGRWLRGLYMLGFLIFFGLAEFVLGLLAFLQFLWLVITGAPNDGLRRFGVSLSKWVAEAARFQACATEEKPFPWKPWPSAD